MNYYTNISLYDRMDIAHAQSSLWAYIILHIKIIGGRIFGGSRVKLYHELPLILKKLKQNFSSLIFVSNKLFFQFICIIPGVLNY